METLGSHSTIRASMVAMEDSKEDSEIAGTMAITGTMATTGTTGKEDLIPIDGEPTA